MSIDQSGEPGRPITLMAAPRHRVIISAALRPTLQRTPNTSFTWQTTHKLEEGRAMVWEADSKILIQPVAGIDLVDELPDVEIDEGDLNGLDNISAEERGRYLKMAIEALPETDGVVVTLFYYDELSLEEIADITGLTNSNIRIKLHRSRKKMHHVISESLKSELSSIL